MDKQKQIITVKVHVKSSKPRVEVENSVAMFVKSESAGDVYHVYVSSLPDKGRANSEVIELLGKHFNLGKSKVNIIKGYTSRVKLVEINK